MNQFFRVPLIGAGTADVECMPSYLLRFSAAHGSSIHRMLAFIRIWAATQTLARPGNRPSLKNLDPLSFVNPNRSTEYLVRALTVGTGLEELRGSTFLAIGVRDSGHHQVMARYSRWCPLCVLEWRKSGHEEYFKLQWMLTELHYCPDHNIRLSTNCNNCGQLQKNPMLDKKGRIVCDHCRNDLFANPKESDYVRASHRNAADLIRFVEHLSCNPSQIYPADGPQRIVEKLRLESHANPKSKALHLALLEFFGKTLRASDVNFSFRQIRVFASLCGLPIHDVLAGNLQGQFTPLDLPWDMSIPHYEEPPKRVRRRVDGVRTRLLRQVKKLRGTSPSLRSIAKSLNVSVGYLRYRFPVIAKQIAAEYVDKRKRTTFVNRCHARGVAIAYFTDPKISRAKKSRKQAIKAIRKSTPLAKHLVRREVNEVYIHLERRTPNTRCASLESGKATTTGDVTRSSQEHASVLTIRCKDGRPLSRS
jgi:hypothetical protein